MGRGNNEQTKKKKTIVVDMCVDMKNDSLNDNQKMVQFKEFFGKLDPTVFAFIKDKLNG